MNLVVADASPLIAFGRSEKIALLQVVVGSILIPETVWIECVRDAAKPGAAAILRAQASGLIQRVSDVALPKPLSLTTLDAGGKAAIAMAMERRCPVLIDERLGRKIAKHYAVPVIGSAGILLNAKQRGLVSTIEPILNQWTEFGYRLSDSLIDDVLRRANER